MSSKLRDALTKASIVLSSAICNDLTEGDAKECLEVIEVALAEPPLNCEVGTVAEQRKRFHMEYFSKHSKLKRRWSIAESALDWAQMPYEEVTK